MVLDNFWERLPRTGRRKRVEKHFPPLGSIGLQMLAGRDLGSLESDFLLEMGLTSSFEGAGVE